MNKVFLHFRDSEADIGDEYGREYDKPTITETFVSWFDDLKSQAIAFEDANLSPYDSPVDAGASSS